MLYAPRPSVRIMRRTTMVALSLVGLIAFLSTIESATAAEVECRDKAKDSNHNGVIDADETQECGGQEYGEGGSDGAKLPPVSPSSHQWQGYHWSRPSDGERKVIMRDSTTDGWDGYLGDAIRDWGDSSRFRFTRQQAATSSDERFACSMPSNYGRVRVCNHADYNLSGFTGLASIRVNSEGHIQRGRVRVKNSAATGDRRALLCQEVGHTIGLDHRSSTSSCMHQNSSAASADPDSHDYDELRNITHSHGGESETGGPNSDLDLGGGLLDGCDLIALTCTEVSSHGSADFTIRVGLLEVPLSGWIGLRPVLGAY